MKRLLCPLAAVLLCAVGVPAQASVIFHVGPGKVQPDENLLFGSPPQTGNTITGFTQITGFELNIMSTDELTTPSAGQARVEADAGMFSNALLTPKKPGDSITALLFNVMALADGFLKIDVVVDGVTESDTFDLKSNGANWFGLEAKSGSFITSVTLTSSEGGESQIIQDIRQIRLSGTGTKSDGDEGSGETPIPEPGTLALWGIVGLGSLGAGWLRRRKAKNRE